MNGPAHPRNLARRRAFTLAHVLIAMPLLAVFSFVSTQLLLTTWRVSAEMRGATEAASRLDGALHVLRADAWGAREISVEGTSATLRRPDGSAVVWQADPAAGTLTRTAGEGAAPTRWDGLPAGVGFAADDAALRLSAPNPATGGVDQVTMASQMLLAGRGQ